MAGEIYSPLSVILLLARSLPWRVQLSASPLAFLLQRVLPTEKQERELAREREKERGERYCPGAILNTNIETNDPGACCSTFGLKSMQGTWRTLRGLLSAYLDRKYLVACGQRGNNEAHTVYRYPPAHQIVGSVERSCGGGRVRCADRILAELRVYM